MSIIEKAAGRLGRSKNQAPPDGQAQPVAAEAAPARLQIEREPAPAAVVHEAVPAVALPAAAEPVIAKAAAVEAAAAGAAAPQATPIAAPAVRREARTVSIDLEFLHRRGMVTPDAGRTPIAEEFRVIKRPLIKSAFQDKAVPHSNLIMVTSSLPGEGKTYCAINLAMSIAMERDHTVLLVDADVARPSVPGYLGLEAGEGLMDVLLDEKLDLGDVMLRTNVDTLRILPAGRHHKNATELLASLTMSNLLDEISRRYPDRIVIFDSPPLLITSEARALASRMGQIVMVVEAEKTTRGTVKDALRLLGHTENLSLLYNKSRNFAGVENYRYGYGYGYN